MNPSSTNPFNMSDPGDKLNLGRRSDTSNTSSNPRVDSGFNHQSNFSSFNTASQAFHASDRHPNPTPPTQTVSSGSDDIVLSNSGSKKKTKRGMILLIIIMTIIGIVGCVYLLWQNGALGGGNDQPRSQNELKDKYNSYINYVLWGSKSNEDISLESVESITDPYFEMIRKNNREDGFLETYIEEADDKYNALVSLYQEQKDNEDINFAVIKSFFQDYAGLEDLTQDELLSIYQADGEPRAREVIGETYSTETGEEFFVRYVEARKELTETLLDVAIAADASGCTSNGVVIPGCYQPDEERWQLLGQQMIDVLFTSEELAAEANRAVQDLYMEVYNISNDEEYEGDEQANNNKNEESKA